MLDMLEELYPNRQTEPIRGDRRAHLPRPRNWQSRKQEVSATHDKNHPARGRERGRGRRG